MGDRTGVSIRNSSKTKQLSTLRLLVFAKQLMEGACKSPGKASRLRASTTSGLGSDSLIGGIATRGGACGGQYGFNSIACSNM